MVFIELNNLKQVLPRFAWHIVFSAPLGERENLLSTGLIGFLDLLVIGLAKGERDRQQQEQRRGKAA